MKILDPPEQPPQLPMFPHLNIQILPDGVALQIFLGPGTSIMHVMNEADTNNFAKQWALSRKEKQSQLQIIKHISQTKNN